MARKKKSSSKQQQQQQQQQKPKAQAEDPTNASTEGDVEAAAVASSSAITTSTTAAPTEASSVSGPTTSTSTVTSTTATTTTTTTTSTTTATVNTDLKVEFWPEQLLVHQQHTKSDSSAPLLVGAIDQGTSSTRFVLFNGQGVAAAQMEHAQLYPQTGWHEHDPVTLWHNTVACMDAVRQAVFDQTSGLALNCTTLKAIGITNQRETVLAWNRGTGQPYYNAIVWDDTRTASYAQTLAGAPSSAHPLTAITGLPVSSYFAGTKVKWLLDHVPELARDVRERPSQVCFGTVDTWLLWQLTGQEPSSDEPKLSKINTGGCFCTDVTNASRWLFMDLKTCQWNTDCIATVVAPHVLPTECLPTICPSSHIFGYVHEQCSERLSWAARIPLASVLGDQQAALFGQTAFTAGRAKNTYGTGLFLMMNTGPNICTSKHGLLTTVAYQLGQQGKIHYALEGSVSHSGSTVQWLRDQLQIITTAAESETLARTVDSSEGAYLVPAFAGLLAPHWRSDARGCWVGLQMSHNRAHLCRAVLEATAYQTKEVFDAMLQDTAELGLLTENDGEGLTRLCVDGGGTHNALLMQFQADLIDVPVVQPQVMETTALGAAFAAGLAVGVWQSLDELQQLWAVARVYQPNMTEAERATRVRGWNKAVSKSLGWVGYGDDGDYSGHLDTFQPVAQPMSSRSLASTSKSSSSHNGNGIAPPQQVVVEPAVTLFVEAPILQVKENAFSDEQKDEPAARSKGLPIDCATKETIAISSNKYSATALGLTAAAAVSVGLLIGGVRRR